MAKHKAAQKALHEIELLEKSVTKDIKENVNNGFAVPLDSVSHLQNICQKNHISLPIYEQLDQLGPSHYPIFWFSCKITIKNKDFSAKGSGKTKQVAKRISAEEVLKDLFRKGIICSLNSDFEIEINLI